MGGSSLGFGKGGGGDSGGGGGGGGGLSFNHLKKLISRQAEANKAAALQSSKLSNPNVFNPYGSRTIEYEEDTPTITEALSENQQGIFDTREQGDISLGQGSQRVAERAGTAFDDSFNYDNAYDPGDVPQVRTRDDVRDALIAKSQPFIDERRRQSESDLLIQGHTRGGRAWNTSQNDLANVEAQIYNNAVVTAGQEQQRDLSTREQAYTLGEGRRARDVREELFTRNQPLAEARALRGEVAQQLPSYQGFAPSQVQPVNSLGAFLDLNQQRLGDVQAANRLSSTAGSASKTGAGNLAGSAISAIGPIATAFNLSDRRLKTDINKIGTLGDLAVYAFRYLWDLGRTHVGFMADEVDKIYPDAVIATSNGYYAVNYSMVLNRITK